MADKEAKTAPKKRAKKRAKKILSKRDLKISIRQKRMKKRNG